MNIVHRSKFFEIEYFEEKNLLKSVWHPESEIMTDKQIKKEIIIAADVIIKHKALFILADDSKRLCVYSVDIQNWVADTLANACDVAGVRKFAVIRSKDLIVDLSTEQTAQEIRRRNYNFLFCKDIKEALEWFGY